MHVFQHERIDSTSSEAFRLLSQNFPTPFAVTAKMQDTGRGQHSRKWESPPGNLFVSIACEMPRERMRYLPLMSACTIMQWLAPLLKIRPEIKWPNDLLLLRKKFAGILCESSWQEKKSYCKAVIGIGINIEAAPDLPHSDYETTCLRPWLLEAWTLEELLHSFLNFWEFKSFESTEKILSEFEEFHVPKGQIWRDREKPEQLFTNEGLSSEGHLILRSLTDGSIQELVSAQHSLKLL